MNNLGRGGSKCRGPETNIWAGGEIVYIGWGGWTVVSSRESSGKRAEAARYQIVRAS